MRLVTRAFTRDWVRMILWLTALATLAIGSNEWIRLGTLFVEGEAAPGSWSPWVLKVSLKLASLSPLVITLGFGLVLRTWIGNRQATLVELTGLPLERAVLPAMVFAIVLQAGADQRFFGDPGSPRRTSSAFAADPAVDPGRPSWVAATPSGDGPWTWLEVSRADGTWALRRTGASDWQEIPAWVREGLRPTPSPWRRCFRPLLVACVLLALLYVRRQGDGAARHGAWALPLVGQGAYAIGFGIGPNLGFQSLGPATQALGLACGAAALVMGSWLLRMQAPEAPRPRSGVSAN